MNTKSLKSKKISKRFSIIIEGKIFVKKGTIRHECSVFDHKEMKLLPIKFSTKTSAKNYCKNMIKEKK